MRAHTGGSPAEPVIAVFSIQPASGVPERLVSEETLKSQPLASC